MDIQTAKQIRIADYLHSLGYSPVKQQGINLWYKSPLREETEASSTVRHLLAQAKRGSPEKIQSAFGAEACSQTISDELSPMIL